MPTTCIRVLVAESSCSSKVVAAIQKALSRAFPGTTIVDGAVTPAGGIFDLEALVLLHTGKPMSATAMHFLQEYQRRHPTTADDATDKAIASSPQLIVPVALDPAMPVPPSPLDGRKSTTRRSGKAPWEAVVRTLQVHFGLALRHRDHRIFVSYRAIDGTRAARSLHDALRSHGFRPWLDVAEEVEEAEENVPGASRVQRRIEAAIRTASAIVFVDTPKAGESKWIRREIDCAIALGIPILHANLAPDRRTSFLALQGLRRSTPLSTWEERALDGPETATVIDHLSALLRDVYLRSCQLYPRARETYEQHGWVCADFQSLNHTFEATRTGRLVADQHTLTHCATEDPRHAPTLQVVATAGGDRRYNHRVVVYGDEPLTPEQLAELHQLHPRSRDLSLAHIGQLEALVRSNFTELEAR